MNCRTAVRRVLTGTVAFCVATAALPAFAQELQEIVVSAQKRDENIQDVGIAITALTGEELQNRGLTSVQGLMDVTPGLRMESSGNASNTTFTLRGVGQRDIAPQNEAATVLFTDGAYVSFLPAAGAPLYDIERVEVLKGPQGTLFGRNATGGLIHVISKRPSRVFDAYTQLTVGENGQFGIEGAVGGPLSDTVSGRLSFYSDRHDGYIENRSGEDGESLENYSARAQLLFEPNDDVSVLVNARASLFQPEAGRGQDPRPFIVDPATGEERYPRSAAEYAAYCNATFPTAPLFGFTLAPPGSERYGNCFFAEPDDDPFVSSFNETRWSNDIYGATVTVDWRLRDGLTLTSITDWLDMRARFLGDADGSDVPLFQFTQNSDGRQLSQELRLSGEGERTRWVAGIYYLDIDIDAHTNVGTIENPGFLVNLLANYSQDTQSIAGFVQGEYDFADRWTVIAGFRWTEDDKHLVNRGDCVPHPQFGVVPAGSAGPGFPPVDMDMCQFLGTFVFPQSLQFQGYDGGFNDGNWSGKLQLNWRPMDDVLVYGGVTRANKAGGFNSGGGQFYGLEHVQYDQEILTSYEVGFKSTILGGTTRFNGAVFHYDYDDYQSYLVVDGFLRVLNVDAEIDGAELELITSPAEGWQLQAAVTWLDGEQKNVPLGGNRFGSFVTPGTPKLSATGFARYEWPALGGRLGAQLGVSYVDERTSNAIDYRDLRLPSYTRLDARLTYTSDDGHWTGSLWVNNLTDEKIALFRTSFATLTGAVSTIYDKPRWFGATIGYRW